MSLSDPRYLERRIEEERYAATSSPEAAAQVHRVLLDQYRDRLRALCEDPPAADDGARDPML